MRIKLVAAIKPRLDFDYSVFANIVNSLVCESNRRISNIYFAN